MQTRLTRSQSRLRTRERLLQAAANLFSERGYHGVSVDAIAERAGFTKGAVYANFASKEEFFLELLNRHTAGWDIEKWVFEPSLDTPIGTAEEVTPTRAPAEDESWTRLSVEFWLAATRSPEMRLKLAKAYDRIRSGLASRRRAADNFMPPRDSTDLAVLIVALDLGLSMQAVLDPASVPASVYDKALRMILAETQRSGSDDRSPRV